jgi:autotransporter strand-loop-strand O-heptosyltransferase
VPASPSSESPAPPAQPISAAPDRRAFPPPAETPTQQGPRGLRFDFNDGCRVAAAAGEAPWRVRLSDLDTGNILFEAEIEAGRMNSAKRLEAWQRGESVLCHDYSAAGREVLIQFLVGRLGDALGWFPYAVKFKERHGCRLTCSMDETLIRLFRGAYPDITFVTHAEVGPERYYATYNIGLFFDQGAGERQRAE